VPKANGTNANNNKKMQITGFQLASIVFTAIMYFGFFNLNEFLFSTFVFSPGVNWIFLPAGLRLLFTLLFGWEGAIGLAIGSLAVTLINFPAFDIISGLGAAAISAGAPYLIYRLAIARGMPTTLQELTAAKLSILIVVYAASSSMLHQMWFVLRGISADFLTGFGAMFIGDLGGTLILIYAMKVALSAVRTLKKKEASNNL
jgi:hypothetical protein